MSRPEHIAPADVYYNEDMAEKYAQGTRMINIQSKMTERCLELMMLSNDDSSKLILDVGCGSGISSGIINEHGHFFVGMDISPGMLQVALSREVTEGGDLMLSDIGQGVPFRPGTFDGVVSVSVLQWLCNEDFKVHESMAGVGVPGKSNTAFKRLRLVVVVYIVNI
jgi:18S rRNA (guanine1575-N7)-methyltransferase